MEKNRYHGNIQSMISPFVCYKPIIHDSCKEMGNVLPKMISNILSGIKIEKHQTDNSMHFPQFLDKITLNCPISIDAKHYRYQSQILKNHACNAIQNKKKSNQLIVTYLAIIVNKLIFMRFIVIEDQLSRHFS
jgi:hypothetical protein